MDELNFHRPENDGRNQCLSLSPFGVEYPNGDPMRCVLERDHTLEHACEGYLWTDDEERKNVKSYIWDKVIVVSVLVFIAAGLFALAMSFVDPHGSVPLWYKIVFWGSFGGIVVGLVGSCFIPQRKGK